MATTRQHIDARNDTDLQARFIAAAEQAGMPAAEQWVRAHMGALVAAAVDQGQTVADIHAYATTVRDAYLDAAPPPPGANLAAVTDTHLTAAITALNP
jgi:hypothetical protein